jgi:hypothetical protein
LVLTSSKNPFAIFSILLGSIAAAHDIVKLYHMRFQAFLTFLALCGVVLAMNSTDDKFFGYEEVLTETIRNDVYSTANIYITKTGFVPVHTSVPIIQRCLRCPTILVECYVLIIGQYNGIHSSFGIPKRISNGHE